MGGVLEIYKLPRRVVSEFMDSIHNSVHYNRYIIINGVLYGALW